MDFIERLLGCEMESEEAISLDTLKTSVRALRKFYRRGGFINLKPKCYLSNLSHATVLKDYCGSYYESYYDDDCQYNSSLEMSDDGVELQMTIEMRYAGMVTMRVLDIPVTLAYGLLVTLIREYNGKEV